MKKLIFVCFKVLFLCFSMLASSVALSEDITYIDKRNNFESHDYAVVFSAKDGKPGHAFVTIVWTNEEPLATLQKSIGFYPIEIDSKVKILSALTDGKLLDDSKTKVDITLSVLVDKAQFDLALRVIEEWEKPSIYYVAFSDCTTFVQQVSAAIGLEVPSRIFATYPHTFVKELIAKNP